LKATEVKADTMVTERIQRQIDALLAQTEEALQQRNWQLVLDCCKDVLALDPDNADA